MFRRRDPLYRTFAAVLSIIVFAAPIAAQPVSVPTLNTPAFNPADMATPASAARASNSESGFESLIQQGILVLKNSWETQVDAAIDAELLNVSHSDHFNTTTEYRDYLRKELEIQKQTALSNWELQADLAIEAERMAFLAGLSTQQRNDTVQQGDSEVAAGQQSVRSAAGDADEARKRFDNAREDYEQTYQAGVSRTMQEYNTALAQIEADRAAFEAELAQAEAQFQQNFTQIQQYETTVRNAIGAAVTGLEGQLQNSGVFHAETCDAQNVCTTDPNTLNASGQTLQTLLTNLRDGLNNSQPLSTLAQQLQQYLAQRETQAIQNRDYWDALIYENRALANEGTQPGQGLNFALYANTITGHVIDYLNGNTASLINARSSGHRVAQDFAGVDLRGHSPSHNPYPLTGASNRINQWWVAGGVGTGALTYDAMGCGGPPLICLWNPGAPNGFPEFFINLAGTYRLFDANAENNRDVWAQYATNLNTENANWLNNILPAIQNWEAQVANYQTSYNAWQVQRTALEQQNTQNYNQRVADIAQSRNQYLTQIEQEYRDGLNQFAILERQLAAGEAQQAQVQEQTSQLVRGGTLIQGGKTAAELIAASHLQKLKTPESISHRANQAIPDFASAQNLLPSFQKTLRGTLNVAVAENLHDDAKDTQRKASEELVGFARSLNDTTVTDAEVHAALAAQMDEYSFDVDPATIQLDWEQLEVTTQAEFDELRANTRKSIEDRKKRQQFKRVEILASGSIKITRDLSKGRTFLKAGGNAQSMDDYIEEIEETSFIIDGSGAAKLSQTAGLFDDSFDANKAFADFETNKEQYQESVHGAKLAAQAKINEQNALVEEMHKRAMKHTQMQVEMAQQMASLAQALITGGTLQSWIEGQMRGNLAGMIEDATGFPAGFISGLLGGASPADAAKSWAEGLMMSQLDTALGLPPGSMSFLVGEQRKKSAAKSSPTAKLASNMASMGTVMGTIGGMAAGFLTGGPLMAMAGAASGFAASKAAEPAMNTFYERNPMAMDAAAFMATAATGNPGVWYTYQGAKGYHNGGALGAVTAVANTGLVALSSVGVQASIAYSHEGGFSGSVGVGLQGVGSVGVSYSEVNGAGASLSLGQAVGPSLSIGTSQYGGSSIGANFGVGVGGSNSSGVISAGLSYNTITGAGVNAGFSTTLANDISSGGANSGSAGLLDNLGVGGNLGLNWNETDGFGAEAGFSLSQNPGQENTTEKPEILENNGNRTNPLSGSGLNLDYTERTGLSLSASLGRGSLGSYDFETGDFHYNENFARDAADGLVQAEYTRKQTEELNNEIRKTVASHLEYMTPDEFAKWNEGKMTIEEMADVLKRVELKGGKLAGAKTDDSSFGDGVFNDLWSNAVMLGETIIGRNSGKYGFIDSAGEFHVRTCFVAGTLVRVKDGTGEDGGNYKRIENIRAGDLVLSWNEITGEQSYQEVYHTFVRETDKVYELAFADGTVIETTWNHPFRIENRGWIQGKDLRIGDVSITASGRKISIERIQVRETPKTVYNFSVSANQNYYVSHAEILVHNQGLGYALAGILRNKRENCNGDAACEKNAEKEVAEIAKYLAIEHAAVACVAFCSPAAAYVATWLQVNAPGLAGALGVSSALTRTSVSEKLTRYLLDPSHPAGKDKARWFQSALGYTQANSQALAKQIVFDSNKAVQTAVTQYGTKYNQIISVVGANGRIIDVTFAWIKNNDGVVRLVTAIPTAK